MLTKKAAGSFPYYEGSSASPGDLPEKFIWAFLPFFKDVSATFPPTISIKESWQNADFHGTYLFLSFDQVLDLEKLVENIEGLRQHPANRDLRFLWIEHADEAFMHWRWQGLSVDIDTSKIRLQSFWDLRNYSLVFPAQTQVVYQERTETFTFGTSHLPDQNFSIKTEYGAHELKDLEEEVRLPMSGKGLGTLGFGLSINRQDLDEELFGKHSFGYPALRHLDISMRTFFRDPSLPGTNEDFSVESLTYPLFNEVCINNDPADIAAKKAPDIKSFYPTKISFQVQWDMHAPHDENRCFLAFDTTSDLEIPSSYRSQLGYTIHLNPQDQSKLVFAERPNFIGEAQSAFYLIPVGAFGISLPDYADKSPELSVRHRLICGLSGVEYFSLPGGTQHKTSIHFLPFQKAFSESFLSLKAISEAFLIEIALYAEEVNKEVDMKLDRSRDYRISDDDWKGPILNNLVLDYFPQESSLTDIEKSDWLGFGPLDEALSWLQEKFLTYQKRSSTQSSEALQAQALTSWAYLKESGPDVPVYFAQPDESVFFEATAVGIGDLTDEFLSYLEVPAEPLPDEVPENGFPLFPHGGIQEGFLNDYLNLENQFTSKLRRDRVHEIRKKIPLADSILSSTSPRAKQGTTPQGLLASFSADFSLWKSVLLAKDTEGKSFQWVNIKRFDQLQTTLQSNKLFAVISKPSSVNDYFSETINGKLETYHQLTIKGWTFDFEPINPSNRANKWSKFQTIFILKYQDRPLLELIDELSTWAMREHFVGDASSVKKIQQQLKRQLKQAVATQNGEDEKAKAKYKPLAEAASYASWTGILALNVTVPPKNLPEELRGLAAGIDADKFFAQYVSIETTQILPAATLSAQTSSIFGLIDYNNDGPAPDTDGPYNFQVRSLSVVFRNSDIFDFAAEIELTLDELFGESTQLLNSSTGLNLVQLKGTAERHDDKVTYSFSFSGENKFLLPESEVLEDVSVIKAQFITDPVPENAGDNFEVSSRFSFWGKMNFRKLAGFDILSFGADALDTEENPQFLSFSSLEVLMRFPQNNPVSRTFTFEPERMSFNLKESTVREQSLYAKFPLKLSGLTYNPPSLNQSPTSKGFAEIKSPLSGGKIGEEWYAFTYQLDLGSLGALAGDAGLLMQIMVAWSPQKTADSSGVLVAIRLPGFKKGKAEISLQGILKLVFKSIRFVVGKEEASGNTVYMLKIKKIALKLFILTLPPNTQGELTIFGDPEGTPNNNGVGWYGAITRS